MLANRTDALDRFRASESWLLRISPSELGGASWCGVTLEAWGEQCASHGLPVPTLEDWKALAAAGKDVLTVDQVNAFYSERVLEPVRFDDLPSGVDYAVADWAVNSGVAGALRECRDLYRTPLAGEAWRTDVFLLKALCAPPPALVVEALCSRRWARMLASPDFTQPSAVVAGKIVGDGRAKRMSDVHRGAIEMIGFVSEAPKYTAPRLSP